MWKYFKGLIGRIKEKRTKRRQEKSVYYQSIAKVHQKYINETGRQPTEFRMKLNRNTDHFNEWCNKNFQNVEAFGRKR